MADNRVVCPEGAIEDKQCELFGIRPPSVEQALTGIRQLWVNPAAMLNLV
jgi:hypothetical protein